MFFKNRSGASRLMNTVLSRSRKGGHLRHPARRNAFPIQAKWGLTAVPGPVEGKGEVNSPEMQVGTVLISARHVSGGYGGFKGLRPAADP